MRWRRLFVVLGVYLLGRDLFDANTGLLAAALGLLAPMFILLSGALVSHLVTMALLTFFAWGFVRAAPIGSRPPDRLCRARRRYDRTGVHHAPVDDFRHRPAVRRASLDRSGAAPAIGMACLRGHADRLRRDRHHPAVVQCRADRLALHQHLRAVVVDGSPRLRPRHRRQPRRAQPVYGHHQLSPGFSSSSGRCCSGWPDVIGVSLAWLPLLAGLLLPPLSKRDWALMLPPIRVDRRATCCTGRAAAVSMARAITPKRCLSCGSSSARGLIKICAINESVAAPRGLCGAAAADRLEHRVTSSSRVSSPASRNIDRRGGP